MAYVKNWLHCVWGTKNRTPFLTGETRPLVLEHITQNAISKGIYIKILNGSKEHLHCLLSLDPEKSLSYVMQLIKGEASFWINRNRLTKYKFEWAEEYYAVSVSESDVSGVIKYIESQEEHHRKKSWEEECSDFMTKYGFDRFPG
jgi:REP element-mobilizing transposase RayT